ncbi:MAG: hypothetical protein NTW29_07205 [Bacteroidetes bacterium]|nr:hypothetical protein [Bacteroidota bacterium]
MQKLFILILILFSLLSCKEKKVSSSEMMEPRFDSGYVDSLRIYHNESLGIDFKIPPNYFFLENPEIGTGFPHYRINNLADRNLKRVLIGKISGLDIRFVTVSSMGMPAGPTHLLSLYYSTDTTERKLWTKECSRQISLLIGKKDTENLIKKSMRRLLTIGMTWDAYFHTRPEDLQNNQFYRHLLLGHEFKCLEAVETNTGRKMLLGYMNYNDYTIVIRIIFKTDEDKEAMEEVMKDFNF